MTESPVPGRRRAALPSQRHWLTLALLFVVFTVVRLPFRSAFLVNWDAVNFALGIEAYDLGHHQPHAPGYIGYVALGRLMTWLTGDPNTGLTLLSVVAGGLLPAGLYLLARRLLPHRAALPAALLIGTSPVVWYYSTVALTYVIGAVAAVFVAWAVHVARLQRSAAHLHLSAVLLAVVGALRQTDLLLLLPALVWAAWAFPWRQRRRAAVVLGAACLVWLVPLMIQAGGPLRYLDLSRQLAALAGGRTWAIGMSWVGMLQNVGLVAAGLLLGLNIALIALPAAVATRRFGGRTLGPDARRLLRLWAAPALFTFVFVHTGQIGYVLLVLPAALLWLAAAGDEAVTAAVDRAASPTPAATGMLRTHAATRRQRRLHRAGVAAVGGMVAANLVGAFAFPHVSFALLTRGRSEPVTEVASSIVAKGVAERTRQYLVPENDDYWADAVDFAENFDPDRSVVLAVPTSVGTFRHLAFYLPDHTVYGVGPDVDGDVGHLFTAAGGDNTYSVAGLSDARSVLVLPPDVEWLIVADRAIQARLPGDQPTILQTVEVGAALRAVRVELGSALLFDSEGGIDREDLDSDGIVVGPAERLTRLPNRTATDHDRVVVDPDNAQTQRAHGGITGE